MLRPKQMNASRYEGCVTLSLRNQGTQVLYLCGKEGINVACLIPHADLLRTKYQECGTAQRKKLIFGCSLQIRQGSLVRIPQQTQVIYDI